MLAEKLMPLTDAEVRSLAPGERPIKRFDGRGLYIEVAPTGSKLWRLKYRVNGTEKRLALGAYPLVRLSEARRMCDAARLSLAEGKDPGLERKRAKATQHLSAANTFSSVANEFVRKREKEGIAQATASKARWFIALLEPVLGSTPLNDIDAKLLLSALKKIEATGRHETAKKTRSFVGRVFRYAVATGRADTDPSAPLIGALTSPKVKHRAAILETGQLAVFLRSTESYGSPVTRLALKILAHVFLRPGELRLATWSEIDFDRSVWRIPAERMKMRRPHHVPLSPVVIDLLGETLDLTGPEGFIFPAAHTRRSPMSENTLNAALRRMGFDKSQVTAHGFRSTASTFLNECGLFRPDVIERALAHASTDAVRAAYHRGEHWEERVAMAAWWSEFLVKLGEA
jgi:integrase